MPGRAGYGRRQGGTCMTGLDRLTFAFHDRLRPYVLRLAGRGATAEQMALAALIGSFAVGEVFWWFGACRWVWLLLPVWLAARAALNAVEAMLAREHWQESRRGLFLNEISGVLADAAIILPFTAAGLSVTLTAWCAVLAAVVELAGAVAVQAGGSRRIDGPMGRGGRALAFSVLAVLVAAGVAVRPWLNGLLLAVALLCALTVWRRMHGALRELDG